MRALLKATGALIAALLIQTIRRLSTMARLLSQIATVIRGSIGGITYTANQFHAIIMRARVSPVQPNTTAQQLARSAMISAQETWNGLTDTVRSAWQQYARFLIFTSPTGTYTIPGRQAFIAGRSLQNYLFETGLAVPTFDTDAPQQILGFYLPQSVNIVDPVTPLSTGIGVSITSEAAVGCAFLIEISAPFTGTRNRFKGPWDTSQSQGGVLAADATVVVDFVDYNLDDVLFVRVKIVADDAPPRVSSQVILRGVAVTIGA